MPDKTCFVMMPFSDQDHPEDNKWDELFDNHLKPAVEGAKLGYKCVRSMNPHGSFMKDAVKQISTAEVAIAILSELRPNVMYELGIRHALKRKTIMLVDKADEAKVPSDLNNYVVPRYTIGTKKGNEELRKIVRERLTMLDARDPDSDSPVSDYLEKEAWAISDEWHKYKDSKITISRIVQILPSYARALEPILPEVIADINELAIKNTEVIKNTASETASPNVKREVEAVAESGARIKDLNINLSPAILQNMAYAAANRGDYIGALAILDTILSQSPLDADTWHIKGLILNDRGYFLEALECFEKAVEIDPTDSDTWTNRGLALSNLDRHSESLESFEKAIALDTKSAQAWTNQGVALDNLGRYEEALKSHKQAIKLEPKFSMAWANQSVVLLHLKRTQEALQSTKTAITIDSNNASAWSQQGVSLRNLGRYEKALESHENATRLNPNSARFWNNKGVTLRNLNNEEEALESFEKALAINPNYAYAWTNKGLVMLATHRYEEALLYIEKALTLADNDATTWLSHGIILTNLGKHKEALESFEKAAELDPNSHEIWFKQGITLNALSRFKEALSSYDRAIEIDARDAALWSRRGYTLFFLQQFGEAVISFQTAINLNTDKVNNQNNYNDLGFCLEAQGMNEEALKNYDQAIELEPNLAHALFNKSSVLKKLGNIEESANLRLQALKLDLNVEAKIMEQKKAVGLEY